MSLQSPLYKLYKMRVTGGDAYHQLDHDLQGVFCVFQHDHDRRIHDRGACECLRNESALSVEKHDQPLHPKHSFAIHLIDGVIR
jgi:hypothetical protein